MLKSDIKGSRRIIWHRNYSWIITSHNQNLSFMSNLIRVETHFHWVHKIETYRSTRPAKLSKVHFSRKFQGKMHLNFWLSGSPISPYFHPKNLPIPPKVYLLKVQGTKSKASIDFHCPLWQVLLSSLQLIWIQTLLSPLWSNQIVISYMNKHSQNAEYLF